MGDVAVRSAFGAEVDAPLGTLDERNGRTDLMLPVSVSGPALIDVSTARVLSSLRVTMNQSPVLV
ncbi:MAG: hypothetical protein BHV65_12285 [Alistipes sp. 58_9_plus]|nr:MAG: hypothetical protein BHV65_12285 [Alistipes sp. 58_9_plus]